LFDTGASASSHVQMTEVLAPWAYGLMEEIYFPWAHEWFDIRDTCKICSWVFNGCWTQYSWLKGDDCDWRNGASTSTYLYFWMLGLCRCRYSRLVADLVSKTWSDSRYVTHVFTPVSLVFVLCCEHFSASWGKDVKRLLAEVVVAESTTLWSGWFRDVNYQTRERCNCRFQMHMILSKVIWEHLSYRFSFSWLMSW
jgi:hypothetical protein